MDDGPGAVGYFSNMSSASGLAGAVTGSNDTSGPECPKTDLSVVIPALGEGPNLAILLPWLKRVLGELKVTYELIVITKDGDRETIETASNAGSRVLLQESKGYGGGLVEGLHSEDCRLRVSCRPPNQDG
jgi:hypothetical protein